MTAYFFECRKFYPDIDEIPDMQERIKEKILDTIIIDLRKFGADIDYQFIFYIKETNCCGTITDFEDNVIYPAYDTWDGWIPIINYYSFSPTKEEEKYRQNGFFSLADLYDYVKTIFPKVWLENQFIW